MKLISVQSRGDRLVVVETSISGLARLITKNMACGVFIVRSIEWKYSATSALKAAAEWLEGAEE
jgi:hypothetical protein